METIKDIESIENDIETMLFLKTPVPQAIAPISQAEDFENDIKTYIIQTNNISFDEIRNVNFDKLLNFYEFFGINIPKEEILKPNFNNPETTLNLLMVNYILTGMVKGIANKKEDEQEEIIENLKKCFKHYLDNLVESGVENLPNFGNNEQREAIKQAFSIFNIQNDSEKELFLNEQMDKFTNCLNNIKGFMADPECEHIYNGLGDLPLFASAFYSGDAGITIVPPLHPNMVNKINSWLDANSETSQKAPNSSPLKVILINNIPIGFCGFTVLDSNEIELLKIEDNFNFIINLLNNTDFEIYPLNNANLKILGFIQNMEHYQNEHQTHLDANFIITEDYRGQKIASTVSQIIFQNELGNECNKNISYHSCCRLSNYGSAMAAINGGAIPIGCSYYDNDKTRPVINFAFIPEICKGIAEKDPLTLKVRNSIIKHFIENPNLAESFRTVITKDENGTIQIEDVDANTIECINKQLADFHAIAKAKYLDQSNSIQLNK